MSTFLHFNECFHTRVKLLQEHWSLETSVFSARKVNASLSACLPYVSLAYIVIYNDCKTLFVDKECILATSITIGDLTVCYIIYYMRYHLLHHLL